VLGFGAKGIPFLNVFLASLIASLSFDIVAARFLMDFFLHNAPFNTSIVLHPHKFHCSSAAGFENCITIDHQTADHA
jgi:hypothetical protein